MSPTRLVLNTPEKTLGRLRIVADNQDSDDDQQTEVDDEEEEEWLTDSDEKEFHCLSPSTFKKSSQGKTTPRSRAGSNCSLQQFMCSFPNCSAVFPKRYRLDRHERRHTGERPYICDVEGCEKAFTCRSYLNKHMKRPHQQVDDQPKTAENSESSPKICLPIVAKMIACPDCGQTYRHKYGLKVHRATHTGQLPFKCDICEKAFALKSQLKRHEKRHQGYDCAYENCGYHALTWTSLRKHITVQHRLVHKCDICDKTFSSHYSLLTHEKLHNGEKLVCPFENCGRSYVKKSNLNIHFKTHTDERFHCEMNGCKKKFKHKISLVNHQKMIHRDSFKDVDPHDQSHVVSSVNQNTSQSKRNRLVLKRVSMAQKITGHQPHPAELQHIFQQDKHFRQNELLVQN